MLLFVNEEKLERIIRNAVRKEMKSQSYALWSFVSNEQGDVDDMIKTVHEKKEALDSLDAHFAEGIKSQIS